MTFTATDGRRSRCPPPSRSTSARSAAIAASTGVMTPVRHHRRHRARDGDVRRAEGVDAHDRHRPARRERRARGADATRGGGGAGGNGGVGGAGPGGPVSGGEADGAQRHADGGHGPGVALPVRQDGVAAGPARRRCCSGRPARSARYDAIYIHLSENGLRLPGLLRGERHAVRQPPILQQAWDTLSYSNQGEPVTVTLVFSSGGKAYGPLTETWTIAQGTLTGTVYYNSYGTALAPTTAARTGGRAICFGGATLAIKHGATSPVLVAGTNRRPAIDAAAACATRSPRRAPTLVTQHGDNYAQSSAYALTRGNAETVMAPANGQFAFPAISPDGTLPLQQRRPAARARAHASTSALFAIPAGSADRERPGCRPASPRRRRSSRPTASTSRSTTTAATRLSLASIDFDAEHEHVLEQADPRTRRPAATRTSSRRSCRPTTRSSSSTRWPATASSARRGTASRGELWWVDLQTHTAAALDEPERRRHTCRRRTAPTTPTTATLQYEPTVNPVASGGYAWVVFTSRRLYGNVATQDPFLSDPRDYNPATRPTTRSSGSRPSISTRRPGPIRATRRSTCPAQELLAGNSRGYWVVDPVRAERHVVPDGRPVLQRLLRRRDGGLRVRHASRPAACR